MVAAVAVTLAAPACSGAVAGRLPGPPVAAARVMPRPDTAPDPLAAASIMADVKWLCAPARAGRGSFQPGGRLAADYMARQLAATGLEVIRQPIGDGADNIIGVKRGGPEAVLVSAHYDHLGVDAAGRVYPGADDNASGAAVLLALARAAAHRHFDRTVLFVSFGAEEAGLVGSGAYIADPFWPLDRTAAVLNFDMVGRNFFGWGSGRPGAAAIVGLEGHPALARAARRAAASAHLDLIPVPAHLVELFGFEDRTDDWWFRRRQVLAIHMSTGLHDDYHRPSDTPDKLSPAQLERVARTAAGLLDYLASRSGPR